MSMATKTDAFSVNVPLVRASGAITIERGAGKTFRQTFTRTGGMCPTVGIFTESGFLALNKPIRKYTKKEMLRNG